MTTVDRSARSASAPKLSVKDIATDKAAGLTLRALPHIPRGLKRLALGGRAVVIDGNTLDTTMQLMLFGQQMMGLDGLVADNDPAVARAQLERLAAGFRQRIPVAGVHDLTVDGAEGLLPARHYRTAATDAPLLVFFHGGGHVIGSLDSHDDLCREICRSGDVHVLSVDYRMAPEHKAPAGAEDAYAAYLWARAHAAELGADPRRVAVGGDSAGANLATSLTLRARAGGAPQPALQLLLYPVTDYQAQTRSRTLFARGFFLTQDNLDWFTHHFLDGAEVTADDPRVSPLLVDDLAGLAPALLVTAGFDPLRDEGRSYAKALQDAGTPVDFREYGSLVHGFANFFPLGGDSATAMAEIISALRAHLSHTE